MQSFKRTLDSEPLEWEPLHASSVTRGVAGNLLGPVGSGLWLLTWLSCLLFLSRQKVM